MRKFKSNRLVRDKIVPNIIAEGSKVNYRVLSEAEYITELKKKVLEETQEVEKANSDDLIKELADIQEIIDCLILAKGLTKKQFREIQKSKRLKNGSFKKKHFLETVEMRGDCPWLDYYLQNPDKFQEIK